MCSTPTLEYQTHNYIQDLGLQKANSGIIIDLSSPSIGTNLWSLNGYNLCFNHSISESLKGALVHVALTIEHIAFQLFITDTKRWLQVKACSKSALVILRASASSVVTDTLSLAWGGSMCNSSMIGASEASPYLVINIALCVCAVCACVCVWVCECVCVWVCVCVRVCVCVDGHNICFLYSWPFTNFYMNSCACAQ